MRRERLGPERGHELEVRGVTGTAVRRLPTAGGSGVLLGEQVMTQSPFPDPRSGAMSTCKVKSCLLMGLQGTGGGGGSAPPSTCPPRSDAVSLASVGTGTSPGPAQLPAPGGAQRMLPNGPPSPQSALLSSGGAFRPQGRALGVQGRCLRSAARSTPPPSAGLSRRRAGHRQPSWIGSGLWKAPKVLRRGTFTGLPTGFRGHGAGRRAASSAGSKALGSGLTVPQVGSPWLHLPTEDRAAGVRTGACRTLGLR